MKKIPLHFNKESFDLNQELFIEKQNLIKQIKIEMKRLLQTDEKNIDYSSAKQFFLEKLAEQKKEVNTMNVSPEKLASLFDMDLTILESLENNFKKVAEVVEPSIESFTTYAETDVEITKYKLCADVIKLIGESQEYIQKIKPTNPRDFLAAFSPMLYWSINDEKLIPHPAFIKNNFDV
jgi:hypothetical protein